MMRLWLVWTLIGALGLVGYDAFWASKVSRPNDVHAMEGGNGLPPPPQPPHP
jgi:hypothetical protein